MSDYISKSKLIDHIESESREWGDEYDVLQILGDIEDMVPADVEEVVRCKDCKWRDEAGCALLIVDESDEPKDDDFCSYGERKDEEDE